MSREAKKAHSKTRRRGETKGGLENEAAERNAALKSIFSKIMV
jgi:hypothetical protein